MSFKNKTPNWDDLRLFLAIAEEGKLINAATITGSSSPTLSRRMRHLEDTFEVQLFDRKQSGYSLTIHGRELLARVREMDAHSKSIQSWLSQLDERPVIRITAGFWTSVFISRHLNEITSELKDVRIELLTGANFLNLSQREADIAIRNKTPHQQGLVRKRIGQVNFAVYCSKKLYKTYPEIMSDGDYSNYDWVIPSKTGGTGTSSFWLRQKIGSSAKLTCDSPQAVLEAVKTGVGLCVLPVFIGSTDPQLQQCSPQIESLEHTQWLVRHHDNGKLPYVQKVFRNLVFLFDKNKASFQ